MTTTSCDHCDMAKKQPWWPVYQARCRGCKVRMLANGPMFFGSREAGRLLPEYQQSLRANFGDAWQTAHEEVKAEHLRIKALRETANV